MTPKRKKRLFAVVIIVIASALAVTLTLFALQQNINLFFTPAQIARGDAPDNTQMRIGGMVKEGSVTRSETDLTVTFVLTDNVNDIVVKYSGILPDLFREGQGIVARGHLQNGQFTAAQVLAKHDENYMPPEVAKAIKEAHNQPPHDAGKLKSNELREPYAD